MIHIEVIHETQYGKIIHGDNLEVLDSLDDNSIDSCISDFPYNLSFMGKKWDTTNNFYEWCKARAEKLIRVMKPGGYVAIFGHPKTNHRMKCAFEDCGFKIVEEIDWVYLSGFPKNQDIGKLFDKDIGAKREVIGKNNSKGIRTGANNFVGDNYKCNGYYVTAPSSNEAKKWNGWKTSGLKPAHEPITIFQKPLDGTYIENIRKYGCGAMNIDACRIPISQADIEMLNAKASKNPTTNYSDKEDRVYGKYAEDKAVPANELGRFPANMILDEYVAELLDEQTGITKSTGGKNGSNLGVYGDYNVKTKGTNKEGFGDIGGGSKNFTIIKYQPKVSPKERKLSNGERNPHVTLKPKELIKWLIKLLTPIDGFTIDITAGSCTHAVACEELNKKDGYNLKYINIELMNTEKEPYCDVGKMRVEDLKKG